jgi:hypothetical protein
VRLHGKCCPPTTAHHSLIKDAIQLASVHKAKGGDAPIVVHLTRPLSTKAFVKAHGQHEDVDLAHYESVAQTLTPAEGRKVDAEVMGSRKRQQAVEAIASDALAALPRAARPDVRVSAVAGLDVSRLNPAADEDVEPDTVVLMVAGADRFPAAGQGTCGPGYSKMTPTSERGEQQRGVKAPRPQGAMSSSALRQQTADADTTPPRPPGLSPAISDADARQIAKHIRSLRRTTRRGQAKRAAAKTRKAKKPKLGAAGTRRGGAKVRRRVTKSATTAADDLFPYWGTDP